MRGRPRFGWMSFVKVVLASRGMTVGAAPNESVKDGKEWRAPVNM